MTIEADDVTTQFDCERGRWCTRMGNFGPGVPSPMLFENQARYGGRTGYGPSPGYQLGLASPDEPSVTIQFGHNGDGEHGVGWYYRTDLEHDVWPEHVPTANLATGFGWEEPQDVFAEGADGYVRLSFDYVVPTSAHDLDHPGNRMGAWATFVDRNTPEGDTRVLWIGVKPFDTRNPDRTLAFPDAAVQSDRLAVIVRQAIRPEAPKQFGYQGVEYGPFVQFEPEATREFQTAADGETRTVAMRIYKDNVQRALDIARRLCASDNPHRHPTCGSRRTDAWSADAEDWQLVDVHINPECPRRPGMFDEFGYSMFDVEAGWVSAG